VVVIIISGAGGWHIRRSCRRQSPRAPFKGVFFSVLADIIVGRLDQALVEFTDDTARLADFGSVWVSRVKERARLRRVSMSSTAAPMIAARIAGPLPAEKTPLCFGLNPRQSFMQARNIVRPTPAEVFNQKRVAFRV